MISVTVSIIAGAEIYVVTRAGRQLCETTDEGAVLELLAWLGIEDPTQLIAAARIADPEARPAGDGEKSVVRPATVYFGRVEECRREAERARTPDERRHWLEIARGWLSLAKAAVD